MHNPFGNECFVSYGQLNILNNQNYIRHNCSTKYGSSGSPIILIENSKVIGVHSRGFKINTDKEEDKYNEGNFLFYTIDIFKKEYIAAEGRDATTRKKK